MTDQQYRELYGLYHAELFHFVMQSNAIENIRREPTLAEITAHQTFMSKDEIKIRDLSFFVTDCEPTAVLRDKPGPIVLIAGRVAPPGGPQVHAELTDLLKWVNLGELSPYKAHCEYEHLHPFTDGNGRSGRVLWLWMMKQQGLHPSGDFLQRFYYQSLSHYDDMRLCS